MKNDFLLTLSHGIINLRHYSTLDFDICVKDHENGTFEASVFIHEDTDILPVLIDSYKNIERERAVKKAFWSYDKIICNLIGHNHYHCPTYSFGYNLLVIERDTPEELLYHTRDIESSIQRWNILTARVALKNNILENIREEIIGQENQINEGLYELKGMLVNQVFYYKPIIWTEVPASDPKICRMTGSISFNYRKIYTDQNRDDSLRNVEISMWMIFPKE